MQCARIQCRTCKSTGHIWVQNTNFTWTVMPFIGYFKNILLYPPIPFIILQITLFYSPNVRDCSVISVWRRHSPVRPLQKCTGWEEQTKPPRAQHHLTNITAITGKLCWLSVINYVRVQVEFSSANRSLSSKNQDYVLIKKSDISVQWHEIVVIWLGTLTWLST